MAGGRDRSRALACWMALLFTGCGTPTALPPAAVMLGAWSYAGESVVADPHSLNAGLHVDIAIESADGGEFAGRVTRWLDGDVGVTPDAFRPLTGSVDGAGGVTLNIAWTAPGAPALTIVGALHGDALTVCESWAGAGPGPFPSGGSFHRSR